MTTTLPARNEVNPETTWNAESVFATPADWAAEVESILADIPKLEDFKGKLSESAATLADGLAAHEELMVRGERAYMYAGFSYSVDTTDQNAAAMAGKARSMYGQLAAAASFIKPELLQIGQETLASWAESEPRLGIYKHYFENLFRMQAHVRSGEVEEILGMLNDPFGGAATSSSMLTNADMQAQPGHDSEGNPIETNETSIVKTTAGEDRVARQTVWDNYYDELLQHKNTLAANLTTSIKQTVFLSQVRRHDSALDMMLYEHNIPTAVFHNLLAVFKKNFPVWQKYFRIRRKALGLDELYPYDMWAPLTQHRAKIPFEQAVEWIAEGLLPMGKDYVGIMRNGCLEERWIDVYPNKGKRTGAFSWGAPGTHPFIMMSYTDSIFSLSTLAHELGHSMHSYLTWENQPLVYADYSLFVAEVASNFHQAMVRAHLLQSNPDRDFQIAIIEEAMSNYYRYFFIMPTLARFELETHTRIENGQPLTADALINLMADLFGEAYGDTVKFNREHLGMTWARFGHLYSDYYVYQYATGISGAQALSSRVLRGEPGAVEGYLDFLKAGSSQYPLDVLKKAGVDLTKPEPVEEAFAVMAGYVDKLEELLG
ncbi:MAG: oligoendopeptidase F [Anaerolineales bacterium]